MVSIDVLYIIRKPMNTYASMTKFENIPKETSFIIE